MDVVILGIESSCDDTSAAIIKDGILLSNVIAAQDVHRKFGGVVPELASRAHQQNIIPVVDTAIKEAGIDKSEISAVAFTRGPGLMGSLLVGVSFAKGFALARNIPIIEINHLQGHILSHFIKTKDGNTRSPAFPFLSLLISGGHTQIIKVNDYFNLEILGQTIDDAAGEAFDKCAKVMGLPYPGGPMIDKLAKSGDPGAYQFAKPSIPDLNFSFSGLKTSFLYFIRDQIAKDPDFIKQNINDLCASLQATIIEILITKLESAIKITGIKEITIGGGVAANSGLRVKISQKAAECGWNIYIPEPKFTTDNAAMIAITGYFKFLKGEFASHDITPLARMNV